MTTKQLIIRGRVQGVGFRDWLVATASGLGLAGWVRNRSDGSVEELIAGDCDSVEACIRACRAGPPLAIVDHVAECLGAPPDSPGFGVRPTL